MKKILLTVALGCIASYADAQHVYQVEGTTAPETKQVYVVKTENRRAKVDTINVENGRFALKGENTDVSFVYLMADNEPYTPVPVMLDGQVSVDLKAKTLKGTEEHNRLSAWWNKTRVFDTQIMELSNEMQNLQKSYRDQGKGELPDSIVNAYYGRYYELRNEANKLVMQCAIENAEYKFPAVLLVNASLKNEEWVALADANVRCFQTPLLARYARSIEGWRRQAVGAQFTDLEMADTTGTMRQLSEFVGNGKYVLVDFWASWCGPCRQEMPAVKALYEKYHDRGFDIVGVSFDNKRDAWVKSIQSMQINWHHISDLKGWQCAAGEVYGINAIPATLLIGPDGKIVAAGLRAEALAKKLAEIFDK